MSITRAVLAAVLCGGFAGGAVAQNYPARTVRIMVPYAAGGSTDATARLVAQALTVRLGQQFIVENRPGAGGTIGHEAVAKAPADGYTLLFSAAGPLAVTPHTYAKLGYDPVKGFEPIKLVATAPLLLVINPKLPAHTVPELIALAKSKPGGMTYGSFGTGSAAHLAGELFNSLAGVRITHVPYKGSAPALTDLIGGQIDLMFDVLVSSLPHVEAGKLRALAITSPKRSEVLPDIPTMAQAGVEGFDAGTWFGLLAPAGTSGQIVETLSKTLDDVLEQKEFRDTMISQGAFVSKGSPAQFRAFFLSEYDKWGKVVQMAGIKAE